jgi:hypothetical protein
MSTLKIVLMLVALAGAPVGYVFYEAALSPNDWVYKGVTPDNWKDAGYHGAPGPLLGAGLPMLVLGGGAYWLARRRRSKKLEGTDATN